MKNIDRRLDSLEKTLHVESDELRTVLRLPDNARDGEGFHVSKGSERVQIIHTSKSVWADGTLVFDSLTKPPKDTNHLDELTPDQWAELRKAELNHNNKDAR